MVLCATTSNLLCILLSALLSDCTELLAIQVKHFLPLSLCIFFSLECLFLFSADFLATRLYIDTFPIIWILCSHNQCWSYLCCTSSILCTMNAELQSCLPTQCPRVNCPGTGTVFYSPGQTSNYLKSYENQQFNKHMESLNALCWANWIFSSLQETCREVPTFYTKESFLQPWR